LEAEVGVLRRHHTSILVKEEEVAGSRIDRLSGGSFPLALLLALILHGVSDGFALQRVVHHLRIDGQSFWRDLIARGFSSPARLLGRGGLNKVDTSSIYDSMKIQKNKCPVNWFVEATAKSRPISSCHNKH